MKQIATGKLAQAAGKYAENVPMTTACCNACRTCVTTNVLALAFAGIVGAGAGIARLARKIAKPA